MIYNKNKVELFRQRYPEGTRICVDSMENDPNQIPSGTKGTVEFIDDMGTVFCKFDNGRSLGVIPGVDSFHAIQPEENLSEEMEETENSSEDLEMHIAIAKALTGEGIPTPGGKENWSGSTVKSILTNEKYKGDALLQKVYTVDFLSKKKKVNEGEVPQYYVEHNHDAIIEPSVFEAVQKQMALRCPGKNRQSCVSIFSSKIKCGDCGSWYGSKVWHSTSKYRKIIWQCNHKFDGGEKCATPHLDEETIKVLFVKAVNILSAEKDEIIENFNVIKDTLFDVRELETERLRLQEELNVVAELIQQCVNENARIALNQEEYQKRYDGLAKRFDDVKDRLDEITHTITERQAQREKIEMFLAGLEKQEGLLTEFDENLWYSMIEYVTVFNKEDIRFTFKDGTEIKV